MIKSPKSRSEACAGTVKYCREGFFRDFGESFSNEAECLESRGPPSLRPFKTGRQTDRACVDRPGNRRKAQSEDCVGTAQYCSQGFFRGLGEDFANEEECLKSRDPAPAAAPPVVEPEPAATKSATTPTSNSSASAPPSSAGLSKKPFKLRNSTPTSCGLLIGDSRAHSEACLGTVLYCRDEYFREFGENFINEEECLQSRDPAPDPSKKPFKLRNSTPTSCGLLIGDSRAHSEACLGTVLYCRDEYFREFGENFNSEEQCLQSRNPAPSTP
ncbi:hypothetical protein ACQRIT_007258 [Beauveria bassiana]